MLNNRQRIGNPQIDWREASFGRGKYKRKTFGFGAYDKKERSHQKEVFIRELSIVDAGIGCAVWDAAIISARWAHANADLFRDRTVLELGAGCGLTGLVMAEHARCVYLTDYLYPLLENLEYNVMLNSGVLSAEFEQDALDSAQSGRRAVNLDAVAQIPGTIAERCVVAHLDWEEVAAQMRGDPTSSCSSCSSSVASLSSAAPIASSSTSSVASSVTAPTAEPARATPTSASSSCSTEPSSSSRATPSGDEREQTKETAEVTKSECKPKTSRIPRKHRLPGAAETGGLSVRSTSSPVDDDDEEEDSLVGMFGWNSDEEFTTTSSSSPSSSGEQSSADRDQSGDVTVYRRPIPQVDIIFGSELTYSLLSVKSLVQVILRFLKEDGVFYEILSDDRDGVPAFVDAIVQVGFTAHAIPVPDCYLGDYATGQRAETYKFWTFRRASTAAHFPMMGTEEGEREDATLVHRSSSSSGSPRAAATQ